ncbi:nucleotidyltransferase domain-containing protein [Solemya elarraichensis gill symbiont]|uniref:Nucleotidyltransferase n=1 Tax=Solemya elarraichensis gill symbiont TaxID=1918949 RepID=A0A1T2L1I7_9GAMM|nr:nucleotidyltransferase [Solemya elarraichensis gill symbiont]OOZ38957.1 hypothetical protein BOW52_07820 [Solemya elarraichensis gill symbiont]
MTFQTLNDTQKHHLAGLLEMACQELELTKTQFEDAQSKYDAVGRWLDDADHPILADSRIFSQGSVRLGTTVKPLGRDEYDVDLVCHLLSGHASMGAAYLKKIIGDRLKANGHYQPILEEKQRCWRLNYAGQFHMDITPSVTNSRCVDGGLLVPDKDLSQSMKPSNPEGYTQWFEKRAEMTPYMMAPGSMEIRADIEPLPEQVPIKGLLKRIVQICKRHRDLKFKDDDSGKAPISVIITTLAAHSYEAVVTSGRRLADIDMVYEVIAGMKRYIQCQKTATGIFYYIPNPTTKGENFAEKWNTNRERAKAFFEWHGAILHDVEELGRIAGLDSLIEHLREKIIGPEAGRVLTKVTDRMSVARTAGILLASSSIGVGTAHGDPVRPNKFYGS